MLLRLEIDVNLNKFKYKWESNPRLHKKLGCKYSTYYQIMPSHRSCPLFDKVTYTLIDLSIKKCVINPPSHNIQLSFPTISFCFLCESDFSNFPYSITSMSWRNGKKVLKNRIWRLRKEKKSHFPPYFTWEYGIKFI